LPGHGVLGGRGQCPRHRMASRGRQATDWTIQK